MLKPGDVLQDRYVIEDKIGQGGMSYVYRAHDKKLGRVVALKVLKEEFCSDEDFIKKFKNEAMSAARLTHPNIVAAYDVIEEGELHCIVMELIEGITLKNYIARKGKLSNRETIGIAIQAAEGIEAAHKNGIIHRDIKPQNIIISKDGKVKVADFGIAKAVTSETVNAAVIGSVHYISPEQARSGIADARSDLYSLGITMYEMITGRVPFEGENTVSVIMSHLEEPLEAPQKYNKDIYPALQDIIMKLTRKRPSERYGSAQELIRDLKQAIREPEGDFVKLEAEDSPLDETRTISGDELQSIKERTGPSGSEQEQEQSEKTAATVTGSQKQGQPKHVIKNNAAQSAGDINRILKLGGIGAVAVVAVLCVILITKGFGIFSAPAISTETAAETETSSSEENTSGTIEVTLTLSGEELMPNLVGKSEERARAELADMGISMDSSATDFSDSYNEGIIMYQDIAADEAVSPGMTVHVTVSMGTEIEYTLKNLQSYTEAQAREELGKLGVSVNSTRGRFSDTVPKGNVIDWEDASGGTGTEIGEGSSVNLIISNGKEAENVSVPALTNMTVEQAQNALSAQGLSLGETTYEESDTAEGLIINQSVPANQIVARGTAVSIVVSGAPASASGHKSTETENYYYASINEVCNVGTSAGPGVESQNLISVTIRLVQQVDGRLKYTTLVDAMPVPEGSQIPISFTNIQGAWGVDTGEIQVVDAADNEVLQSYTLSFAPQS